MTALQPQTPYYALSPSERTARKAVRAALALPFAMAKRVLAQRTKALEVRSKRTVVSASTLMSSLLWMPGLCNMTDAV